MHGQQNIKKFVYKSIVQLSIFCSIMILHLPEQIHLSRVSSLDQLQASDDCL